MNHARVRNYENPQLGEKTLKKVFISYASENINSARKLYNEFKLSPEIEPWFDKECLLPGMKWHPAIRKAIRESNYFIALFSSKSIKKRGYVQNEIKEALDILREFPEDQIYFIPIRLDECSIHYESLREIQYVDFFPNWNDGLQRVLKVISKSNDGIDKVRGTTHSGYEYRCAISDLDIGLTNLEQIAQRLNMVQKYFHFTSPKISLTDNPIRNIDNLPNFAVYSLPNSVYEQRQYLNVDLVILLTRYPLAFKSGSIIEYNYFSGPSDIDDRFIFISTHALYDFVKQAKCTFEKGIIYIIVSELFVYFTNMGYHEETRGCIMDFCETRSDMVKGLSEMKFCTKCSAELNKGNLNFRNAIQAILLDEMRI